MTEGSWKWVSETQQTPRVKIVVVWGISSFRSVLMFVDQNWGNKGKEACFSSSRNLWLLSGTDGEVCQAESKGIVRSEVPSYSVTWLGTAKQEAFE